VADGKAAAVAKSAGVIHLPDDAFAQQLHGARFVCDGAALRTHLHHALVLARGGHHLVTFENVMARWLFHVHVFARLAGPDRRQRMPVIGRGDRHRIDVFRFEHRAHVFKLLGLGAIRQLLYQRHAPFAACLIHVANGREAAIGGE